MSPVTVELAVPDISCDECKANIEGDLAGDPGVHQVSVDAGIRRIRIGYDQDQTGPQ